MPEYPFMTFFIGIITLIFGNAAFIIPLFLWNRSESRSDVREMDNKLEIYLTAIREDVKAIHNEMKDFHGRLERQDAELKFHLIHAHERGK
jgi:hypothetical protein